MSQAIEIMFGLNNPSLQRINCNASVDGIEGVFLFHGDMQFYRIKIEPIASMQKERTV